MKKTMRKLIAFALVLMVALTVVPMNKAEAATVSISKSTATIWVNNYVTLNMDGTKVAATWKSSDTKIATVSTTGNVVGIKAGTATITATLSKKNYTCKVTVKQETSTKALDNLISDIEKNKNSESACKVLTDEYVTIPYSSISTYTFVDVNWDGVKDLLVWASGVYYDEGWDYYYDVVRVVTVKGGKAVIAGWCTALSPSRDSNYSDTTFSLNKKTKSLIMFGKLCCKGMLLTPIGLCI